MVAVPGSRVVPEGGEHTTKVVRFPPTRSLPVTTAGAYAMTAPSVLGVRLIVAANPLTSSVGGVRSNTLIGNCPVLSFPAGSAAVHVAVHEPSGMKVEVPLAGSGTVPDGPVRTQVTEAVPLLSLAVTVTPTFAPPGAFPSRLAR